MTTSERWIKAIDDACAEADAARSNQRITRLHYFLSEALAGQLGREGGPNFHSWAVWGSRKAGVTIRQEDLDTAILNATAIAAVLSCLLGAALAVFAGRGLGWANDSLTAALGAAIGALSGDYAGRQFAIFSRAKAARLILRGNQIVLEDIGTQSARFLELLENGAAIHAQEAFFAGFRPGPTEQHGQDRLATAFRSYLAAFATADVEAKRAAMIAGNCEIVYHEHIRLEPYIRGAMPLALRRCVTRRCMTYTIGELVLTVTENLPGIATPTAARNWARFEQRMRYVFALFRKFHTAPEVFSAPYPGMELAQGSKSGLAPN